MKKFIQTAAWLLCLCITANAQKPAIDTAAFNKWPALQAAQLSNDGKYAIYTESYENAGHDVLHVRSLTDRREFTHSGIGSVSGAFLQDSRYAAFQSADSLFLLKLKGFTTDFMTRVQNFQLSAIDNWLAWLAKDSQLTLINMTNRATSRFDHIRQYQFNKQGNVLILLSFSDKDEKLTWVDLYSGKATIIWQGNKCEGFLFNNSGDRLVIRSADKTDESQLFVYSKGNPISLAITPDANFHSLAVYDWGQFSQNGRYLLYKLHCKSSLVQNGSTGYPGVSIANSLDEHPDPTVYWAVAQLNDGTSKVINPNGEIISDESEKHFGNYILLRTVQTSAVKTNQHRYELVDLGDLSRQVIEIPSTRAFLDLHFSPDERFVVWYAPDSLNYFSYEVQTKFIRNVSKSMPEPVYDSNPRAPATLKAQGFGIANYGADGHSIYLYDQYDLWKTDLLGQAAPVNVTAGYGRLHRIIFSLMQINTGNTTIDFGQPIKNDQPLLISGFDLVNKQNGFWIMHPGAAPEKLCMENACYHIDRAAFWDGRSGIPDSKPTFKAKNAGVYLISRQTASDFPNFYVTTNFRDFEPISDFHPEKAYNWLTAELLNWRDGDGESYQGILYKPENFDASRKYPVIFHYYDRKSSRLYAYEAPDWTESNINIPYFVSNGYLVLDVDINFYYQHFGAGAVQSVTSAAKYLSRLAYVDSSKLAIQGHSYGGYETNFIVTHTHNIFAAACSASGSGDLISLALKAGRQANQFQLGGMPWACPELYRENSPIFGVTSVTTPLLIMQGAKDLATPYEQAIEMNNAFRAAGKRCWLLSYSNASHWTEGDDAKDFTIRLKQFFDHYLMNAPSPVWMTAQSIDGRPINTSLTVGSQ